MRLGRRREHIVVAPVAGDAVEHRKSTDLTITGMTCASCAARVQRKLDGLDDVSATVNYATGRAVVDHPHAVGVDRLVGVVESLGYGATVPAGHGAGPDHGREAGEEDNAPLRRRLIASVLLSPPVLILAMVPAWQFPAWQWVSLALTLPVVL